MKRWRATWKVFWRLAVGCLLLLWIFHSIFLIEGSGVLPPAEWARLTRWERWRIAWSEGPRELWKTLRLVHFPFLLASLVCMGMTLVIGVFRWRYVLRVQGLDLSLGRAAEISFVGHFFNSFLLGSTGGDLLKAYYAARETHHKKTEAVMTVVVDRLFGLFSLLFFACVMMLPNFALILREPRLGAAAWVIFLLMLGCGAVITLAFWGGLSRAVPQARDWLRRLPKGELIEKGLEATREFGKARFFVVKMLAFSMVLNVFCVLQICSLAAGLNLNTSMLPLFVIVPTVVCLSAIPISPSGLGVRENLYVLLLSAIQVDATSALSLSLLAYAGSLAWSVFGGFIYMARRTRDHLDEITNASPSEDPN